MAKRKILYYQCFSGISGDMNLAALTHLGVPPDYLAGELEKLGLTNVKIRFEEASQNAIYGTKVTVEVAHPTGITRRLQDVYEIIEEAGLEEAVTDTAKRIFAKLAEAEGKIHNKPPDKIHFHEVGGEDAIIDITGAALAWHYLKVDEVWASTVELGSGFVKSAHGVLPVPAPATTEILRGMPVHLGGAGFETTTPTGAAILATLVSQFTDSPRMNVTGTGYGIGHHPGDQRPNMLRVFLGEYEPVTGPGEEEAEEIECTIDDMNPEWYDWIINRLLEAGAQDVILTPVIMKKNRPGMKIYVLCPVEKAGEIGMMLFRETTTLGYRHRRVSKKSLERKISLLDTPYGQVRIKEAYLEGRRVNRKPEYDDCRRIAGERNLPVKQVYEEIIRYLHENDQQHST